MDSDDAEEVNTQTENKYIKDAKVGEGTYAVVYSGMCYKKKTTAITCIQLSTIRSFRENGKKSSYQKDQNGALQRRLRSDSYP